MEVNEIVEEISNSLTELINENLEKHMKEQPYNAVCDGCGKDIDLGVTVDGDNDLQITVPICDCQKEE